MNIEEMKISLVKMKEAVLEMEKQITEAEKPAKPRTKEEQEKLDAWFREQNRITAQLRKKHNLDHSA
jgi:hypothetical protein